MGIVLVFVTLAVFLNLRVAFWVAAGLPLSSSAPCTSYRQLYGNDVKRDDHIRFYHGSWHCGGRCRGGGGKRLRHA